MAKGSDNLNTIKDIRIEDGLGGLLTWINKASTIRKGHGIGEIDIGYFANVIRMSPDVSIALSMDGVGSKVILAQMMGRYDTIGIDCIAMNVNDVLCVGAEPVSFLDAISVENIDSISLGEIGEGLYYGAKQANVNIVGGEIAQMPDVVQGYSHGTGIDIVGTCIGILNPNDVNIGQNVEEGDVLIGIRSSGLHSNGFTLARKVLFSDSKLDLNYNFDKSLSLGDALLEPTTIYTDLVKELKSNNVDVKAYSHITGSGLFNIVRIQSMCGYVIESFPEIPPLFSLIQELGQLSFAEMFRVFNMGIGFTITVSAQEKEKVISIIQDKNIEAFHIGHAFLDDKKRIFIDPYGLCGENGQFTLI